ncbi:MAG TPA: hypothetical protein GX694_06060 [Actinomycetales bacterium]|nr:hypothetical protein [Actinomycetales bacterium]
MPQYEFDVDASIAAGWDRFASHLAELMRDLAPGGTFDIAVPVLGSPSSRTPFVRFTVTEPGTVRVEVSGGQEDGDGLGPTHLVHLGALGWEDPAEDTVGPHVRVRTGEADEAARLVAATLERVFGIPHPVFLHDATGPTRPERATPDASPPEHPDFAALPIGTPDEATRAVGTALAEIYERDVPADEHDVFAVPAGSALLFVRVHRSLPLVIFRSPLVSSVRDVAAAETEVAILNRDSLWCRYVFDGETIYAESELVDRVFVTVNFKIQLIEMATELDDVDEDLARRVSGKRWSDLRAADDRGSPEQ